MRRPVLAIVAFLAGAACWAPAQGITTQKRAEVQQYARQQGWPVRIAREVGGFAELRAIDRGQPVYYGVYNLNAAKSISVDKCWPGASSGLNLTGAGVRLGVWDGGGVFVTHMEFQGRATQMDGASPVADAGWQASHATHVAGTMIAGGVWPGDAHWPAGLARGMAWQARVDCYDWYDDADEMESAAAGGLQISNHSYGPMRGWDIFWDGFEYRWYWLGDVTVNAQEDYWFGRYSDEAQLWDEIARAAPFYLFVCAAGNDRGDTGPSAGEYYYFFDPTTGNWETSTLPRNPDGPYDSIAGTALAKNGLTVGAVEDVTGGYSQPSAVRMTSFSSWGPADDGRIKPDVVGNGYQLFSPSWVDEDYHYWIEMSGTSMASPNVSGSLALLIQRWRQTHPNSGLLRSATLKALVINTADECGDADGPDYRFGWGLVNTLHAAQLLQDVGTGFERVRQEILPSGAEYAMVVPIESADQPLRVTICWADPPGTPPADTLDNAAKMLVNDLDLRIEGPSRTVYYPWVLDVAHPTAAATTGDNNTDNVEQVVVAAPEPGMYVVRVTYKGTLVGGIQPFGLVVSGAISEDCNGNNTPDVEDIASGFSRDCNGNSLPDECEDNVVSPAPVIYWQPEPVECCLDEPVKFSVLAGGAPILRYQWRKDGQPISGENSPTYKLEQATPDDEGVYDVVVYEPNMPTECSETISAPATLTIADCPPAVPQVKSPSNYQHQTPVNVVLQWEPAARATSYDVYFGPAQPAAFQGTVTDTQWDAGRLQYGLSYYWRIVAHNDVGATEGPEWWFVTELMSTLSPSGITGPSPADGAVNVPVDVHLAWTGGQPATSYQVLMGTKASNLAFEGGGTWVGLDPTDLVTGTTYYWQVIAMNDGESTAGPVWSFKTEGTAPVEPNEPNVPVDPNTVVVDPNDPNNAQIPSNTNNNEPDDPNQVRQDIPTPLCPAAAATLVSLTVVGLLATRPRSRRLRR